MNRRNFLSAIALAPLGIGSGVPEREVTIKRNRDATYSVWHRRVGENTIVVSNYETPGQAVGHARNYLLQDAV